MSQAKGYASVLQVVAETVYGTAGTPLASIPIISHTLKPTQQQDVPEILNGNQSDSEPQDFEKGCAGDIVIPLDGTHLATWLATMFDPATGLLLTEQGSLTIGDPVAAVKLNRFVGCKIARLQFSFTKGQAPRCTLGIIGAQGTAETAITPTALTTFVPFLAHQLALTLGEAALDNVTQFDLTIDRAFDTDGFIINGTTARIALSEGPVKVTGSITALFVDATLQTLALGRTSTALGFVFTNADKILTCALPEVKFGNHTQDLPGPRGRFLTLPFTAYWATGEIASSVQLTITDVPA